jgi:hypothetical protein
MPAPTIKVRVLPTPKIKVHVSNTGQIISTNPVTIGSTTPVSRFDGLLDVNPGGEIDGAVPVYDANTDTYIVKHLDIAQVDGSADVDGGSF